MTYTVEMWDGAEWKAVASPMRSREAAIESARAAARALGYSLRVVEPDGTIVWIKEVLE